MQEKHICSNCDTEYSIKWIPLDEENEDDEIGFPIFCPFCSSEIEIEDNMDY
jgi:DNA-directed RNA polymerase subunit RPC12/RpoP